MEIVGINRNGEDQFVVRCEKHNWYYNGRAPITTGCDDCWLVYYFCQVAQADGDKKTMVEQLESAIRHVAEHADKGTWDFKPDLKIESIEKEN